MALVYRLFTQLLIIVLLFTNSIASANEADDTLVALVVDIPFIELHSGPAVGYPVIYVIEKGEQVKVQLKRTNWLKIIDKRGNIGWLSQDELLGLTHNGQPLNEADYNDEYFFKRDIEAGVLYGDFEGANFYNIYVGYAFTDVFSAEISAGKALGNISDSDIYEMMWVSQLVPDYVIIPYVAIGGGIIATKPHSILADAKNRQDALMSAAIGVKYHVARNFLLRAEYKYALVLTDRNDNEEIKVWKLGFSIFF